MNHSEQIIEKVKHYVDNILRVEGEIDRIIPFGNSLIVKFKNGSSYKQSFICKETGGEVTLDYTGVNK